MEDNYKNYIHTLIDIHRSYLEVSETSLCNRFLNDLNSLTRQYLKDVNIINITRGKKIDRDKERTDKNMRTLEELHWELVGDFDHVE